MRGIIRYYGGKTRMASKIVKEIDKIPHTIYAEGFVGGASVLFTKPFYNVKYYREVINDINEDIVTMYRAAQKHGDLFRQKIENTPFAHAEYNRARHILKNKKDFDELDIAWAVVVGINLSYAYRFLGGWRWARTGDNQIGTWNNFRFSLKDILERFHEVVIDCEDILKFINRWDSPTTLFYLDPPYPETTQNYKYKYTVEDWKNLCDKLDTIQGSYILSGYYQDYVPKSYTLLKKYTSSVSAAAPKRRALVDLNRIEHLWIKNNTMPLEDINLEITDEIQNVQIQHDEKLVQQNF